MKEYEIMLPKEGENLVNLSNSILKEMGVKPLNNTLSKLDKILLEKNYKNIILMLYDGLGTSILEKYLPEKSFLRSHKVENITSVFPATTVAATTSVLTGLEVGEHGWLGWDMYFKDDDETISVYTNKLKGTEIPAKHKVKERKDMLYKTIIEKINEETENEAYMAWPYDEQYPCNTLEEINNRICNLCNNSNKKKFIYSYHNNPDKILHQEGRGINIKNLIEKINLSTEKLYNKLPSDTLIIVIADHGHIECKYKFLSDNKELFNMLERTTTLESRAAGIKLKEDVDKKYFQKLFKDLYGKDFRLYSKEEVFENHLFGNKMIHKRLEENIGDYIAIAIKDVALNYDDNCKVFKSTHAGITKNEMEIPLIIVGK